MLPPGISRRKLRRLAKKMDRKNPELRKMYLEQQGENKTLDKEIDELSDELNNLFDHNVETPDEK